MLHKPPMLLVDKIIEENDKKATTSFAVKQDCIFLDENNILSKPALIEIAAQSFAAANFVPVGGNFNRSDERNNMIPSVIPSHMYVPCHPMAGFDMVNSAALPSIRAENPKLVADRKSVV